MRPNPFRIPGGKKTNRLRICTGAVHSFPRPERRLAEVQHYDGDESDQADAHRIQSEEAHEIRVFHRAVLSKCRRPAEQLENRSNI